MHIPSLRSTLLAVTVSMVCSSPAFAEPIDDFPYAVQENDLKDAARLFKQGNPAAQKKMLKDAENSFFSDAASGKWETVAFLLESGMKIDTADRDKRTALMYAADAGNLAHVEALIHAGADVNAHDGWGDSVLDSALRHKHAAVIDALKKAGATTTAAAQERDAHPGQVRYVWGMQGVNLRETPAADAHVVAKLEYGTPLLLAGQDAEPKAYKIDLFPEGNQLVKGCETRPQIALNGHWIKVKTRNQQGYVFDRLTLPYLPSKQHEGLQTYMTGTFDLAVKNGKSTVKDGDTVTDYIAQGERKVTMTTSESQEYSSGYSTNVFIPDMGFEEGVTYFFALSSPPTMWNCSYKQNTSFEFSTEYEHVQITAENGGVRLVTGGTD
jgi:hypothetical protein